LKIGSFRIYTIGSRRSPLRASSGGIVNGPMAQSPDGQIGGNAMIQGNQTWQLGLAQLQKQAYYVVEIPDFAIAIASFPASAQVATTPGGYGVTIYGVGLYGT